MVMPEWPEAEHLRKVLNERGCGRNIVSAAVLRPGAVNEPEEKFRRELVGRQIAIVERRGHHLIFHLDDGNRLLLRLSAGTRLFCGREAPEGQRNFQVIIEFADESRLFFGGLKAGGLSRLTAKQVLEELKELGPEPLDARLSPDVFLERLSASRGMLKTALTGQKVVAGIGSRYGDEICYDARIHPGKLVARLSPDEIGRLYASMRQVLAEAAAAGGLEDKPLFENDRHTGGYREIRKVADREGEPCPRCGTKIAKGEVAGRKSHFCPKCQRKD